MKVLDLKLARDLWSMRGQAMAIALVLAAGTATFVLSSGVHRSLAETRDAYYERNRFADVFVDMTRAPSAVVDRVAAAPGVGRVQGAIRQYATLDLPGRPAPVRALLQSVGPKDELNRLFIRTGRLPAPDRPAEVVIDEAFAKANGLGPGARIDAVIHGVRQTLRVVGTGTAPDYIYVLAPGDLIPDETRFGVIWMGLAALAAATDRVGAINSLSLTLDRGASEADVIRRVDVLLTPYGGGGAYGRKDQVSHAFVENELSQLRAMSRVIPPVFLLVSTFLVYVVLMRLIQTERAPIGLFKAFGYSNGAIGWHYMKFPLAIALAAILLGWIGGVWMGRAMTVLYADYYRFPFLTYRVAPDVLLTSGALALASAALGGLGGLRGALRLTPAVAMAPPAPPVYRAGLVERLGRAAGFTPVGHMIARHIARWPGRSAATVLGVALSIGLLFATVQFLDASRTMLDTYFYRTQRQDMTVSFVEARNEDVLYALADTEGVLRVEPVRGLAVVMTHGLRRERVAIEGARPGGRLSARIDADGSEVPLPPDGLMLSRQLARKLAARPGDRVEIQMLGGRRSSSILPVTRIIDEFVGERAYASSATIDAIARDGAPVGAALLRIDPADREGILAALKDMPMVLGVAERDAALARFEQMIDRNIVTMLTFYISFASAIAVGVVYNSARILFSERAHELATLRVLGYFRSETAVVLLGELGLLTALAAPIGCVIGYGLGQLMTALFSSDLFRLPFAPARASYGWSVVAILIAASLSALVVARRVLGLDMVRVLKARD